MSEACRIIITQEPSGLVSVSAPMKYKALCYDILKDAAAVIRRTPDMAFYCPGLTLLIVMDSTGTVDVSAPLPPREWCSLALRAARTIIEQFESSEAKMQPAGFADCLPTPK